MQEAHEIQFVGANEDCTVEMIHMTSKLIELISPLLPAGFNEELLMSSVGDTIDSYLNDVVMNLESEKEITEGQLILIYDGAIIGVNSFFTGLLTALTMMDKQDKFFKNEYTKDINEICTKTFLKIQSMVIGRGAVATKIGAMGMKVHFTENE